MSATMARATFIPYSMCSRARLNHSVRNGRAANDRLNRCKHESRVLKADRVKGPAAGSGQFYAAHEVRWKREHFVDKAGKLREPFDCVVNPGDLISELIPGDGGKLDKIRAVVG